MHRGKVLVLLLATLIIAAPSSLSQSEKDRDSLPDILERVGERVEHYYAGLLSIACAETQRFCLNKEKRPLFHAPAGSFCCSIDNRKHGTPDKSQQELQTGNHSGVPGGQQIPH
jgi:hypothetical protein